LRPAAECFAQRASRPFWSSFANASSSRVGGAGAARPSAAHRRLVELAVRFVVPVRGAR
jgi:hypothetical protein